MNQLPGFDPRLNEPQGDAPGGSNGSHMTAVGSLWPVATVIPAPTSFTFGTAHAADSLGGAGAPLALAGTPSAAAIAPPLLTAQSPGGRGGYPPGALLSGGGGGGGGGGKTAGAMRRKQGPRSGSQRTTAYLQSERAAAQEMRVVAKREREQDAAELVALRGRCAEQDAELEAAGKVAASRDQQSGAHAGQGA